MQYIYIYTYVLVLYKTFQNILVKNITYIHTQKPSMDHGSSSNRNGCLSLGILHLGPETTLMGLLESATGLVLRETLPHLSPCPQR